MNKTYKIVFNRARGKMMVANELTKSVRKGINLDKFMQLRHTLLALAVASAAFGVQAADSVIGNVKVDGTAVNVSDFAGAVIGSDSADSVIVSGKSDALWLQNATDDVTIKGTSIGLSGTRGITTQDGAKLTIGNDKTQAVLIKPTGKGFWGVFAWKQSSVTINTALLTVEVEEGTFGLHAQNNTQQATPPEGSTKLIVNADKTVVKSGCIGLSAYSNAYLEINGDLQVDAPTAVNARGHSTININPNDSEGKHTVVLNGNIEFTTPGPTQNSGDVIDANVNINLTNAASSWTGALVKDWPSTTPDDDAVRTSVKGFHLTLANGATWNATETPTESNEGTGQGNQARYQAVNRLTLNNGVISLAAAGQEIQIENLDGMGGTVNLPTEKTQSGLTTGKLAINSVTANAAPTLTVNYTGITSDTVHSAADLDTLASAVSGEVRQVQQIAEGGINGAITRTLDESGRVVSVIEATNQKLDAFESQAAMNVLAWRHDMNDLTKRMGELRDSPEGIGSWVRFYGSEQEYGRQNVTSKSTSVQLGSDYDIGSGWKVGGAFTYTDGTAKYDNGSSDNKAYGVAAYGSWLADNGAFVDLIGKYSRLSSDFELSSMDGKSKNNALSASVEAGWHIPFAELAFVEPQAELTYGVVLGDDFTTSNGVKISQEDTEALIGRLGVRTGFHFPNKKGTVYARASVLHDFKGESEFTASLVDDASVRSTMKDDIGGTYYEIGVGANFNWTDNAYSYVDLEKQNGGDVKENWRWNVGFRYVW